VTARRPRVLHVIPAVAPRYGGPSQALVELCAAQTARGLSVMLASTDADGPGRLRVPIGTLTTYEGVSAIFFSRRLSESFKYAPALVRWLRRSVSAFDVVHIHAVFSHTSLAAARLCGARNVPYVVRPLGSLAPWGLGRKRWRKRVLMLAGGRRMLERAAAVHYTTRAEQALAEQAIGPTPGVVVPLGIDETLLRDSVLPAEGRSPVVLALGRLHPVKNLEGTIAAFHRVADTGGQEAWRLVIAGEGSAGYRRRLGDLAAGGPGRDRITFVGWLDGGEKRDWLRRSALFVQTSHQESFGVSIIEAMAAGVPVLVSPGVHLARDISEAGAGWVTDGTTDGLAAALRIAMTDADLRASNARGARELAARFTWAAAAAALEAVYERAWTDQHAKTVAARSSAKSPSGA